MKRLVTALVVFLLGFRALADEARSGCGLPIVHGTAGGALFLAALETNPYRIVSWRVGSDTARRIPLDLPGRFLPAGSSNGTAAWLASVGASRDVHLFRVATSGEKKAGGTLHTVGEPTSFSWTTDRSGSMWIVVATLSNGERRIETFRREGSRWNSELSVRADDLCTPRPSDDSRSSIVCGAWRFSANARPQAIDVNGDRGLAEIYSDGRRLIELRLADLTVLTSSDSGAHWHEMPTPWPPRTNFTWPPEAIDRGGDAPLLRWVAGEHVHVARFEGSAWTTILDAPMAQVRGLSGPAAMVDGALVMIGLCYRTRDNAPDSFDAAVIENGAIRRMTVGAANLSARPEQMPVLVALPPQPEQTRQ